MPLTPQQMDAKMDEHFAFEGRDDVEGVLATLTSDAEHDIVGWPPGRHTAATPRGVSTRPCSSTCRTARSRP